MAASLFSQPPVAYFQPLESPPNTCAPSFISGEAASCTGFGGLTEFKTISSKVCGWAGELGKNHDLRQRAEHCAWLFSEQVAPFQFSSELPSSALISTAQQQARVDFLSSAEAMKSIFRAACDVETDVGVTIHRLGDWLVIDDGSELSGCPGGQASADRRQNSAATNEGLWEHAEHQRRVEQHHCAAVARAEVAEAKSMEAQERVDNARALLWEAEMEAKRAQEELQEALAEVSRAAEARDRLAAAAATSQSGPPRQGTHSSASYSAGTSTIGGSFESQDEPTGEHLQLYCNFLGHSIRLLQDEPCPSSTSSEPKDCDEHGELVPLEGPPEPFRQVGVWKIADDASVVVGSRMLCLGNSEHPKLTLYLHDDNVISDMMLLEHWVECLMAGVPEFAICFHRDGAVQSYSLYKVSELRHFLEDRMQIGRRLQMTLEVLRWIKRQCRLEGCSYWLSKEKSEGALKIIMLSGPSTAKDSGRRQEAPLPVCGLPAAVPPRGLVLKNTFLDVQDEEDAIDDLRRAESCPARFLTDGQRDEEVSLSQPLRGRVSALFFRRAVSSAPGPDAARFFRHALDLEALALNSKASLDDDCEGSPPSSPVGNASGRVPLQACSHLGLALCELFGEPSAQQSHVQSPADEMSSGGSTALTALLTAMQADLDPDPGRYFRGKRAVHDAFCEIRYRLLPIWGTSCSLSRTSHGAPLLFVGVPPLRRGFHARANAASDVEASSSSSSSNQLLAPTLAALSRVWDALSLLGSSSGDAGSLPEEDKKRLEALAWPTAALSLLRLASTLLSGFAGSEGLPSQRVQAGACWRALSLGRRFAALDSVRQPRPEPQPLFVALPSCQDLRVRLEHLSGRALLRFAASTLDGGPAPDSAIAAESQVLFDELEAKLAKLEQWLTTHDGLQGESTGLTAADEAFVPSHCRLRGAWHLEQSVRLLPQDVIEGSAREKQSRALLHQLMLSVAAALSEAAAGSLESPGPQEGGSWSFPLEALQAAYDQLCRGEDLATAVGHHAAAALAKASQGHLCSLAADVLVGRVLDSQADGHDAESVRLSVEELSVLHSISEESDASEDEGDDSSTTHEGDGDVLTLIGRLGDQAVAIAMTALQSIDSLVEPGAVTSLSLMVSGVLQSAASRLQALPPPGLPVHECRRATSDMLTRALQVLPTSTGSNTAAVPSMPRQLAQQAACLAAQANLTQCELYTSACCVGGSDKPQQRQQHLQWHLDKARAALHCAVTQEEEDWVSPVTSLVLAHAHLLQSQLLGTGRIASKRPQEQSLQEVMAGCGILVKSPGQAVLPHCARAKVKELLLEQARVALRALCAQKTASDACWKEMYRTSLKLQEPGELEQLLAAYSQHFGSGDE